ncbi:THAP domain-containing protein 1-like [Rhipicephalus sanguineus]|uniref:THAP domain-containing protein 1-like n=1 Tax=Rhipicephalus sanguineus TaxID=34632 RepID=UPI0020C3B250|nr:THAP domain-containing protein 1-like [Rhipicephalus sanguineus]
MPCCCAFGCRNRTEDGKKLFCIPRGKQNLTRRKVWLHRIGRKDFEPSATARLCEDHFTEDQFEPIILKNTGEKKLRPFATPSIFLHRPVAKPCTPPPKRTRVDSTDDPKVKQNTQVDVEPQPVDTENDVPDMQPDPQIPAPFQPESTQAGLLIQAALQRRVAQLETELQAARRKLQLAQRQRLQALTANKRLSQD